MADVSAVTLVQHGIHNPADPRHFMRIKPMPGTVEVWRGDTLVARSTNAVRVIEVGRDLYDPAIYLPRADVQVDLHPIEHTTHCPLKGDASYMSLDPAAEEPAVWSYGAPINGAAELAGRVSFYANQFEFRIRPT